MYRCPHPTPSSLLIAGLLGTTLLLGACAAPPSAPASPAKPDAAHSSANSLDWAGRYSGRLPCADCEAIATTLQLNPDRSYLLQTRYEGKGDGRLFEQRGRFGWDAAGGTIRLEGIQGGPDRYRVAEGRLIQLDMSGAPITGALADRYVLAKATPPDAQLIAGGRAWRLVELMGKSVPAGPGTPTLIFGADGASVSGYSGCNQFGGSVELGKAPQRLRFGQMAATLRACPEMALEQQFLQMLGQADGYHADAKQLQLHRARMAPLARFAPSQP